MKILVVSDTHFRRPGERLPRAVEEGAAAADLDLVVRSATSRWFSACGHLK